MKTIDTYSIDNLCACAWATAVKNVGKIIKGDNFNFSSTAQCFAAEQVARKLNVRFDENGEIVEQ